MTADEIEAKMADILVRMREVQANADEDREEQMQVCLLQWLAVQLTWLCTEKQMNWEKARAVITTFTLVGEFANWHWSGMKGMPPTIMSVYQ